MFTSLSLRIPHRLAIAVGVPLLALALSNAQSVWSGLAEARSMEQTLVLTELGGAMSNVVEGLQRERGLTAGFVGSQGEAALAARLDEQRALTDTAVAALRSAVADDRMGIVGQDFRDRLARTETQLATLAEHRSRQLALSGLLVVAVGMLVTWVVSRWIVGRMCVQPAKHLCAAHTRGDTWTLLIG